MAAIQRPSYMDEERKQDSVLPTQGNNPAATPQATQAPAPQLGSGASTQVGGGSMGGNKAMAGQTPAQYTQSTAPFSRIKSLFDKNVGKQTAPNLAAGVQEQANKGTEQLQAQATQTANALQKAYEPKASVDAQTAAQWAASGQNMDKIKADLSADTSRRNDFNYNGNTSFDGLNAFTSREGASTALAKANAGANYTLGMGKLDSTLLGTSDSFHRQADDAQRNVGAFHAAREAEEARFNARGGLLDSASADAQARKQALRSALAEKAGSLKDVGATTARQENAARQALRDRAAAVRKEIEAQYLKRPEFADSSMAGITNRQAFQRMLNDESLNRFLTAGESVTGYVGAEEATGFNRIMELLGQGDRLQAQGSLAGRGGFDEAGYRAAVDALFKRNAGSLAKIPVQAPSEGLGVPVAKPTFDKVGAAIEAAKSAGRAADPTSASSRTNPISGTANTVAKAAAIAASKAPAPLKPAAKAAAKVAEKAATPAQALAKKLLGKK